MSIDFARLRWPMMRGNRRGVTGSGARRKGACVSRRFRVGSARDGDFLGVMGTNSAMVTVLAAKTARSAA
jgi:hypothetical protein